VPRRPREDRPPVGQAVPRSQVPPPNIIIGGGGYPYYPYYPGYYPGYYPWGYGGIGFGFSWYSPGFYGSWYGPSYYGGGGYYAHYDGAVRLKVRPSGAEVLVDGYYVGIVDEFDNPFQQLQLESGPHRIEVREDGYETLSFEVRIVPGKTITYNGELKKIQ
jgi:PEGA domain